MAASKPILPSLSDPNPLSCIEACWSANPLIVSEHVGNNPEIITEGRVQAPCDERVSKAPAEVPHGFMPTRIPASGRFTVTLQNGCDRSGVLGAAATG